MEIKLPGMNTGDIKFHLPGGDIHITGKWFNYGIIFIVMILDLNMWKNQIYYDPFVYGQYTDESGYIYTVSERDFIANATKATLSYAWRWNHINPLTNQTYGMQDHKMNSRFLGFPFKLKGIAFFPSLFAFAMFGILVKFFSTEELPTKVETFHREVSDSDIPPGQDPPSQKDGEDISRNMATSASQKDNDVISRRDDITNSKAGDVISRSYDVTDKASEPEMRIAGNELEDILDFQGSANADFGRGISGAGIGASFLDVRSSFGSLPRNSRSSLLQPAEVIELHKLSSASHDSLQSRESTQDKEPVECSLEDFPRGREPPSVFPETSAQIPNDQLAPLAIPVSTQAALSDGVGSRLSRGQAWDAPGGPNAPETR